MDQTDRDLLRDLARVADRLMDRYGPHAAPATLAALAYHRAAESPPRPLSGPDPDLPPTGAEKEQADDEGSLHRPKRIHPEILRPQPKVAQVEAEVKDGHPYHGQAPKCIDAVVTQPTGRDCCERYVRRSRRIRQGTGHGRYQRR